jgi:sigma-E factor negative regulatory protein RseC
MGMGRVTKTGVVKAIRGAKAVAITKREDACHHCKAKDSCEMLGGTGANAVVEALNTAGAEVGDIVTISLRSSSLLKGAFVIYMVPILGLVAGIVAGFGLAHVFSLSQEPVVGAMAALAVVVSFLWVRQKAKKLGQRQEYIPEIISKKRPSEPLSSAQNGCSVR